MMIYTKFYYIIIYCVKSFYKRRKNYSNKLLDKLESLLGKYFKKLIMLFDFLFIYQIQIISLASVFFILTSIFSFCIKTHPNCRVPVIQNVTVHNQYSNATYWTLDKSKTFPHEAFFYVELCCNLWFTFEIMIRWVIYYCIKFCIYQRIHWAP